MAEVSFHPEGSTAISPCRAPFGSFVFSEHLPPKVLYDFVAACEQHLTARGIRSVKITDAPLFYREGSELLQTILFNQGYSVSKAELTTGIRVDHHHFDDKIEVWERRKLRQAKDKGAQFKMLPASELEVVYQLIQKSRSERGHSLSMSLEEVSKVVDTFKKEFLLSGVYISKELAAASIAIRVNREIVYNFYSGHPKKFDSLSPVVTLIGGLYRYCHTNHIRLLDLGTSAIHGQPNFPLLDFKLRLGAVPSMKITLTKKLDAS